MALSCEIKFSCGTVFHVYLPKQKIYGEILEITTEDWKEIDKKEIAAGEVDMARELAKKAGVPLIQLPQTGRIECSCGCGEVLDLVEMLQTAKNTSGILDDTQ